MSLSVPDTFSLFILILFIYSIKYPSDLYFCIVPCNFIAVSLDLSISESTTGFFNSASAIILLTSTVGAVVSFSLLNSSSFFFIAFFSRILN